MWGIIAAIFPEGIQPITGDERSDTTGRCLVSPLYPEKIAAIRVIENVAAGCGGSCRPCRGEESL